MRILRVAFLTVVGGFLVALVLYGATTSSPAYTCPIGDARLGYDWVCDGGYTDAWTGAFTPFTQTYTRHVTESESRSSRSRITTGPSLYHSASQSEAC